MNRMRIVGLRISALVLTSLLLTGAWVYAEEVLFSPADIPKANASAGAEKCVEPISIMRRSHMQFIKHQRDATMHEGIRTTKHSLVECINCHVKADDKGVYPDIHSDKHFCSSCHVYAAVQIDCFQCHSTKPVPTTTSAQHTGDAQQ